MLHMLTHLGPLLVRCSHYSTAYVLLLTEYTTLRCSCWGFNEDSLAGVTADEVLAGLSSAWSSLCE
jgi:hypothetical protein